MSAGTLLCIECGKALADDVSESAGDGAYDRMSMVCHNCREQQAQEKEDLLVLPESVTVTVCKMCGARKHGKRWEAPQPVEKSIVDEVRPTIIPTRDVTIRELAVIPEQRTEKQFPCTVSGVFEYRKEEVRREYRLLAALKYEVCEVCSRKHGNYFEAILQLRREKTLSEEQLLDLR